MIYLLRQWKEGNIRGVVHHMERNEVPYKVIEAWDNATFPRLNRSDAIIALGGPASVSNLYAEDYASPFLIREACFLEDARHLGVAFFGICLGHQLRARMEGLDVETGALVFGMEPVELTAEGKAYWLFEGIPSPFYVYQHHRDYVTSVSPETSILATSTTCAVEAASWSDTCVTTQFHPELLDVDIPEVIHRFPENLEALHMTGDEMLARVPADYTFYTNRIFDNFLYRADYISKPGEADSGMESLEQAA